MLSLPATLPNTHSRYDLDDPVQFHQVHTGRCEKFSRYLSESWNRLSRFARLLYSHLLSAKSTQCLLTFKLAIQYPTKTKERDVPRKVCRHLKKLGRSVTAEAQTTNNLKLCHSLCHVQDHRLAFQIQKDRQYCKFQISPNQHGDSTFHPQTTQLCIHLIVTEKDQKSPESGIRVSLMATTSTFSSPRSLNR